MEISPTPAPEHDVPPRAKCIDLGQGPGRSSDITCQTTEGEKAFRDPQFEDRADVLIYRATARCIAAHLPGRWVDGLVSVGLTFADEQRQCPERLVGYLGAFVVVRVVMSESGRVC